MPPVSVRTLPACEATGVTNELVQIANRRGVAVLNVNSGALPGMPASVIPDQERGQ